MNPSFQLYELERVSWHNIRDGTYPPAKYIAHDLVFKLGNRASCVFRFKLFKEIEMLGFFKISNKIKLLVV